MFDYHIHSNVSFDSECPPEKYLQVAEQLGLQEICFTDHCDFNDVRREERDLFTIAEYKNAYEGLKSDKVTVRRGVEFGLTPWNQPELTELLNSYEFDFVMGSVHSVGGYDPYFKEFWTLHGFDTAFEAYLLHTLECVKVHEDFDVLGHLNYACKSAHNPTGKPLYYADYPDICDEIMKILVQKGKGMEINTSGVDRAGDFLPGPDFLKRFKELGGEIVTVGSDSHNFDRLGQYIDGALALAKEVFGHVCTFEKRKPVFHKL